METISEAYRAQLADLSSQLITPERQFPPRTPHTYTHAEQAGATVLRRFHLLPSQGPEDTLGANVVSLFPDLPEATVYFFPTRESGR